MATASTSVTCPDCGERVEVALTLTPAGPLKEGHRTVVVSASDEAPQRFAEHVMSAPDAHPTFVAPTP